MLFGVKEQDLISQRHKAVKELLEIEIRRLVSDHKIDKVRGIIIPANLQEVFGLGYDQFLKMTRGPNDEIINGWIAKIASDGNVTEEEREQLFRQVLELDRGYKLSKDQQRVIENRAPFNIYSGSEPKGSRTESQPNKSYDKNVVDAYVVLGLEVGVSANEIKVAYRRLAHVHHPDKVA